MRKYGFGASHYAQVLCVNEKEADKSLEKGEKYGMWALSTQVSGEKKIIKKGLLIMFARILIWTGGIPVMRWSGTFG